MNKFPDDVIKLADELGVLLDDLIIIVAVRQYLKNLKRVRAFKKNISKKTRDEGNAKRRRAKKKKQEQEEKRNQQESAQYHKDLRYIMIKERAER